MEKLLQPLTEDRTLIQYADVSLNIRRVTPCVKSAKKSDAKEWLVNLSTAGEALEIIGFRRVTPSARARFYFAVV